MARRRGSRIASERPLPRRRFLCRYRLVAVRPPARRPLSGKLKGCSGSRVCENTNDMPCRFGSARFESTKSREIDPTQPDNGSASRTSAGSPPPPPRDPHLLSYHLNTPPHPPPATPP